MSRIWSALSAKRLNLGSGGGGGGGFGDKKMEYVLGGALALIIVGSLALTIYFGFIRDSGSSAYADEPIFFQCRKCSTKFSVKVKDLREPTSEMGMPWPGKCPNCGADSDQDFIAMVQCYKCQHWFVPQGAEQQTPNSPPMPVYGKCPNCGADY